MSQLGSSIQIEVLDVDVAADKDEVLEEVKAAITGDSSDQAASNKQPLVSITGLWSVRSGHYVATHKIGKSVAAALNKVRI